MVTIYGTVQLVVVDVDVGDRLTSTHQLASKPESDVMMNLFASGSNAYGQLAIDTLDDAHVFSQCSFSSPLPSGASISQLSSGANHAILGVTCPGFPGVQLWGSGDASKGQLGPGNVGGPKFSRLYLPLSERGFSGYYPRLVAAAWKTSFIVISCDTEGKGDIILSMGGNDWGNLGLGEVKNKDSDHSVHIVAFDHLDVDSSSLHVKSITAGPYHIIVHGQTLLKSGTPQDFIAGWGISRHGQLGPMNVSSSRPVAYLSCPSAINFSIPPTDISSIALGFRHTVVLHRSGKLSSFGSDAKCQLRDLDTLEGVRQVACTWNGTYVIVETPDGRKLLSTGSNKKGQLGHENACLNSLGVVPFPMTCERVKSIVCGSEHVLCVVSTNVDGKRDEIWAWGWNEHGSLGIGTTEDVPLPKRIWPEEGDGPPRTARLLGAWAGCGTSWIVLESRMG
jgi:protein ATS1